MKYKLRFFFEWGTKGCLWCGNEAAVEKFGVGPVSLDALNLSDGLKTISYNMADEYQTVLNWECPSDPSPWSKEQKEDFLERSQKVFEQTKTELGEDYEIAFELFLSE